MSPRLKLLLISIVIPVLLFPLLSFFFGEDSLNVFVVPVLLSFFFMIFSLIFYKMDDKNNRRVLEEYNKKNNVQGADMLDSVFRKYQKKVPFLNSKKPIVKPFSDLSFISKIFTVIGVLISLYTIATLLIIGFKGLIEQQYEIDQKEKSYLERVEKHEDLLNNLKK